MEDAMTAVQGAQQALSQIVAIGSAEAPAQQGSAPFGSVFQSMVAESNALDVKAQQAVTGLMNGSGVEVHDAMIATEKADMTFELGLQVRNKAVAAYQQMMNMQF
jgi:flagellar hook-basal body complex protein FliE